MQTGDTGVFAESHTIWGEAPARAEPLFARAYLQVYYRREESPLDEAKKIIPR